jgi:AraC-like DNA-binding protein
MTSDVGLPALSDLPSLVAGLTLRVHRAEAGLPPPAGAYGLGWPRMQVVLAGRRRVGFAQDGAVVHRELTPGEALGISVHAWNTAQDAGAGVVLVVQLPPGRPPLAYLRRHQPPRRVEHTPSQPLEPPDLARRLFDVIDACPAGDGHAAIAERAYRSLLDLAVSAIVRNRAADRPCDAICDYVARHLADDLGRAVVAARFRIHPNHLSRLFRRELGCSFNDHLSELRLRRACALLAVGDLSVAAVARSCGFADPDYFARVFRRRQGLTPGAYRRRWLRPS